MASTCHAVIPAAGVGARMGHDTPKQYLPLAGRCLLEHSLQALLDSEAIATVVVALHPQDSRGRELPLMQDPRVRITCGGAARADSVLAGLNVLASCTDHGDWVLVHDAARPCLWREDLQRLMSAVIDSGIGGILAEPVVDTVKRAGGDRRVLATLDREQLWRAQTPQMFRLGELRSALEAALAAGLAITDDASAMEHAGCPVQLVPGSPANLKVTVADDLALAAWYLAQRDARPEVPPCE